MSKNQTEKDIETITLELPSNVMQFLKASCPNVPAYLEYTVIEGIKADLDNETVIIENLREKYKIS